MLMYASKSFSLYFHCGIIMAFGTLTVPDVNAIVPKYVVKHMLIIEELSQKLLITLNDHKQTETFLFIIVILNPF